MPALVVIAFALALSGARRAWAACYDDVVRIANGKVVRGQVVVEGEPLTEGATVTVLSEDERTFELGPDQEGALAVALEEARRGEGVDGDAFLDDLEA